MKSGLILSNELGDSGPMQAFLKLFSKLLKFEAKMWERCSIIADSACRWQRTDKKWKPTVNSIIWQVGTKIIPHFHFPRPILKGSRKKGMGAAQRANIFLGSWTLDSICGFSTQLVRNWWPTYTTQYTPIPLVNCPTRWSLSFIFVFLCWSSIFPIPGTKKYSTAMCYSSSDQVMHNDFNTNKMAT